MRKVYGFVLLSLVIGLVIVGLIVAGVSREYVTADWKANRWGGVAGVAIGAATYMLLTTLFGYLTFLCKKHNWIIITFLILFMFSVLFSIAIAIFVFVAAETNTASNYFSCNSTSKSVGSIWTGVDKVIVSVDKGLCSSNCNCNLTNFQPFIQNTTIATSDYIWWQPYAAGLANKYQDCDQTFKNTSMTQVINNNPNEFNNSYFDPELFFSSFAKIETHFNCTGWCQTYYQDDFGNTRHMWRYLFTNINNGIPINIGCNVVFLKWVSGLLNTFGAVIIIGVSVMIIIWVLALSLSCCPGNDNDNVHHDKEKHKDDDKKEKKEDKKD